MLDLLSASAAARRLTPGRFLLAAAFHGVILYAAAKPPLPADEPPLVGDVVLDPFVSRSLEPERQDPLHADGGAMIAPGPKGVFSAPTPDIPTTIPPVTVGPGLDLSTLRRIATTSFGGPGRSDSATDGHALLATEVDEPAAVIKQPSPRYPPVLQQAGLEGKVLLEFIIDSTGHVESASVRVLERSRPGFDAAAMEAVEKSLFRPARVRGRPVRQRTLQPVVFRIG